jgi:hypothetical protein
MIRRGLGMAEPVDEKINIMFAETKTSIIDVI